MEMTQIEGRNAK